MESKVELEFYESRDPEKFSWKRVENQQCQLTSGVEQVTREATAVITAFN